MSARLGVAIVEDAVLAVRAERRGAAVRVRETLRVGCAGAGALHEALREVHARLAGGRTLPTAVAPAPAEVWVKLLALPPLPPAERARMVEMDADRLFPVRGESVVADVPAEGPVAAVRAADVEALVGRVEEVLGPVHAVEPSPRAAVRAWATLDRSLRRRVFAVLERRGGWWELAVARGGTLLGHARFLTPEPAALAEALAEAVEPGGTVLRVLLIAEPGAAGAQAEDDAEVEAVAAALKARLPGLAVERPAELAPGVPTAFASAVGLALAPPGGLLPAPYRARLRRGARRRTGAWAVAATFAGALLLAAGPWSRARGTAELAAEAALLAPRADSASRLLERAHRAQETVEFTDSLARGRADWLGALAELARRLPEGAYLTNLRGDAAAGTVELRGYAGSAAAIVPLLEASPRFERVESTEPIARHTVGGVELENFAIRLQVVP